MIIKRNLIYVDAKSIRKIGRAEEKDERKEELEKLRKEIIEKAKKEADEILGNAKKEADSILNDARKKYEELEKNLKEEYEKKMQEIEEMKRKLVEFESLLRGKLDEAIEGLVEKSLPVLKVIYKKVLEKDMDEDLARRRIKSALEKIFETSGVRFKISPEDTSGLEDLISSMKTQGFEVVVDPSLKKGDVIVETSIGLIDKTTEFRWRMIEDALDEIL